MQSIKTDAEYKFLAERLNACLNDLREIHARTQHELAEVRVKYRLAAAERDTIEYERDCGRVVSCALWMTIGITWWFLFVS